MRASTCLAILIATLAGACGDVVPSGEPEHITLDHILIGVKGPKTLIPRTEDQGRQVAERVLKQLNDGADWTKLKNDYSEDPPRKDLARSEPFTVANTGVQPSSPGEKRRKDLSTTVGDIGFKLNVGEFKLAAFDPKTCPRGFHILRRVR